MLAGVHQEELAAMVAELDATVRDRAADLIAGPLRNAFNETLATARRAVKSGGAHLERHPSDGELIHAADKVRAAVRELDLAAERYKALRNTRSTLLRLCGGCRHDVRGEFGELRNLKAFWPGFGTNMQGSDPTPSHPRWRLCWLVSGAPEPWLPTRDEQDDLWQASYADAIERHSQSIRSATDDHAHFLPA